MAVARYFSDREGVRLLPACLADRVELRLSGEVFSDPATDNRPRQREGFKAMREFMKTEGITVCYMASPAVLTSDEELVDYYRDRFGDYRPNLRFIEE